MSSATYTRFEVLRTFRSRRFFIFSLGFPLVLYFLIAGPNHNVKNLSGSGISAPLYFMIGLTAFGTMNAMLSSGARIAGERAAGWNRQLRLTPLSTLAYFRTKVVTGYLMAATTMVLLFAAGSILGVRLSATEWLETIGLLLVGLVPFAAIGILMGHLVTVDSVGPAMGGITALLSLFGGVWFPISSGGALYDIAQVLPSYWLVRAAHVAVGGHGWGTRGWIVVAIWTVVAARLAGRAYRRDTTRN
jgi:ABC-2 type transport system permease protein